MPKKYTINNRVYCIFPGQYCILFDRKYQIHRVIIHLYIQTNYFKVKFIQKYMLVCFSVSESTQWAFISTLHSFVKLLTIIFIRMTTYKKKLCNSFDSKNIYKNNFTYTVVTESFQCKFNMQVQL